MFGDDARAHAHACAPSISGSRRKGDGSSDDSCGGSDDSSAAVLELEPLVERVASALEQRCSVRGGDLVRILGSGLCGLETAQPPL